MSSMSPDSPGGPGHSQGPRVCSGHLAPKFSHAHFPRTTNAYGCVTLHHFHFYVERSLPHTPIALWLDGDQLRAVVDHVLVAEYTCHYSWRTRHITALHHGTFYATRFVSPQGLLFPCNSHESLILYRPPAGRHQGHRDRLPQQLLLFQMEL